MGGQNRKVKNGTLKDDQTANSLYKKRLKKATWGGGEERLRLPAGRG